MDDLIRQDVSVLAIHHSSAKVFEDGRTYSKSPMGSTAYEAWARLTVNLAETGPGQVKLSVLGNDYPPREVTVGVRFREGEPTEYELLEDAPRVDHRKRKADTNTDRVQFVKNRIIDNPALLDANTQEKVAEALGVKKSGVQRSLALYRATCSDVRHVPGIGWVGGDPPS